MKLSKTGKIPRPVWKLGVDIKLFECPVTWITDDTKKIMNLLFLEDNPPKIFSGTWLNQPQWYMEAIAIHRTERANDMKKRK